MYYAVCGGIIDWFSLSLTQEEIIQRTEVEPGIQPNDEHIKEQQRKRKEELNNLIELIRRYTYSIEKENPHTIRFFCIPNYDELDFDIYAVAKISNNGSTFLVGKNRKLLELIASDAYYPTRQIGEDNK